MFERENAFTGWFVFPGSFPAAPYRGYGWLGYGRVRIWRCPTGGHLYWSILPLEETLKELPYVYRASWAELLVLPGGVFSNTGAHWARAVQDVPVLCRDAWTEVDFGKMEERYRCSDGVAEYSIVWHFPEGTVVSYRADRPFGHPRIIRAREVREFQEVREIEERECTHCWIGRLLTEKSPIQKQGHLLFIEEEERGKWGRLGIYTAGTEWKELKEGQEAEWDVYDHHLRVVGQENYAYTAVRRYRWGVVGIISRCSVVATHPEHETVGVEPGDYIFYHPRPEGGRE